MNPPSGPFQKIASFITGAAAVITVGSVGYCVKVDHLEDRIRQLEQDNAELVQRLQEANRSGRNGGTESPESERIEPKKDFEQKRSDFPDEESQREEGKSKVPVPNPNLRSRDPGTEIVEGIKFELLGCNKNGSTVLCDVQLTGLEQDIRDVYLTTGSILNASGNEVTAARASLGSIQNHRIHAWGDLVARVPKKGALRFEGIGVDEDTATLLELRMVVGNDRFSVRFRDVTLG